MSLDLYFYPTSFFSQKVRLAIEEKKIPYNQVLVNLPGGEVHSPWYMKNVNSMGQVPVIRHGDKFLADSNEIIKYLDHNFSGRTLWPSADTPEGKDIEDFMTRHVALCNIEVLTYGSMCNPDLGDGIHMPEFLRKASTAKINRGDTIKGLLEKMEKNPDMKQEYENKIAFWKQFTREMKDREFVKEKLEECKKFFDFVEATLQQNAEEGKADIFLYSTEFNMADIILTITLERLRLLGFLNQVVNDGRHPYVAKYHERVLQRPSVQTVAVGGYKKGTLLRAAIYFKMRDMKTSLFIVAAIGVIGYFAWRYSKNS